jgi:hypothetical protein
MNPLVLFDYVFYRIVNYYSKVYNVDIVKEFAGLSILSILQLLNVLTLILIIEPTHNSVKVPILNYLIICGLILTFNLIRYYKFVSYSELCFKWDKETPKAKRLKTTCVFCYCILSLFLLFCFI